MANTLFLVALGGAGGSCLRHLIALGAASLLGPAAPAGTFAVNVLGSFLMGVLVVALADRDVRLAPLLMTGLLGGFTTFSAFSLDSVRLLERGALGLAFAYIAGSVAISLAALSLGMAIARAMAPSI